jgi:histidine ammonia-lyase
VENVWEVATQNRIIALTDEAKKNINKCREFVDQIIADGKVVYGLTTGFGKFASITIPPDQLEELQENLILSHSTGVGENYNEIETRAIMLLRINVLAKGFSGIRLSTLETLIGMLNAGVHPLIPEKGSVGASGDLAPLSHLALVLIGYGSAIYQGQEMSGPDAMRLAGLEPVKLAAKEGLALNNGTQVMAALGALGLRRAEHLCRIADINLSVTVDALLGTDACFSQLVHKVRAHQGQSDAAYNMAELLKNSPLKESHKDCGNVQDPYSLRCAPQVHGAVRDALRYVRSVIDVEINSATDNPLIFPDEGQVISGGNFHGEPLAFALDMLSICVSELANISERRMEQLFNPAQNRGLHAFLASRLGLDSGFMIAQLTAANLVSENKVLSHPASVDSIPTSANQEDHVSMGSVSALKARSVLENTAYVLSIELMAGCQALDDRQFPSSPIIEEIKKEIRKQVAKIEHDRFMQPDMLKMKAIIDSPVLPQIVNKYFIMK